MLLYEHIHGFAEALIASQRLARSRRIVEGPIRVHVGSKQLGHSFVSIPSNAIHDHIIVDLLDRIIIRASEINDFIIEQVTELVLRNRLRRSRRDIPSTIQHIIRIGHRLAFADITVATVVCLQRLMPVTVFVILLAEIGSRTIYCLLWIHRVNAEFLCRARHELRNADRSCT